MKQYTDKDQTAKLIELGFPFPKSVINEHKVLESSPYAPIEFEYAYSIGELIEFLYCYNFSLSIYGLKGATWQVWAENKIWETELIDALFNTCVTLKEGGVI